jgi:hypothetical protein
MSQSGKLWDNAAMESVFSWLKTERTDRKIYGPPRKSGWRINGDAKFRGCLFIQVLPALFVQNICASDNFYRPHCLEDIYVPSHGCGDYDPVLSSDRMLRHPCRTRASYQSGRLRPVGIVLITLNNSGVLEL